MVILAGVVLVSEPLFGGPDDWRARWSVQITSPETSTLMSPPCPQVMPSRPSSVNIYLKNLGNSTLSGTALAFTILVDGRFYCVAANPDLNKRVFTLQPGAILSVGVGFTELQCRDGGGARLSDTEVFDVLSRRKWSISASIVDLHSVKPAIESNRTVSSNTLTFPLSRDACERGISCTQELPKLR